MRIKWILEGLLTALQIMLFPADFFCDYIDVNIYPPGQIVPVFSTIL